MARVVKSTLTSAAMLMILIVPFLLQGVAAAQGPGLSIDQASLRLWPEYDDPGLLVILSGNLTGTNTFPQQVAFPIPPNARGIQATFIDEKGDLLNQPWQIVDGKLTYSLPRPEFQIEYYLDRPPSGSERALSYSFDAPYPIKNLATSVQQPARANGFTVSPSASQTIQGSDGFTYYLGQRANMQAGEKLPFTMRYTKNDQGLSVAQANLEARQPNTAANPSAATPQSDPVPWLPILLIGIGVTVLAGAGVYWFVKLRPAPEPAPSTARPAPRASAKTPPGRPATPKTAFCTQCGRQLNPGDRFCAQCGTARRD